MRCQWKGAGSSVVTRQQNCVTPPERLLTLKQGVPQLKLKCWQLFSLFANFISTSMAELSRSRQIISLFKPSVPSLYHKYHWDLRKWFSVYVGTMWRYATFRLLINTPCSQLAITWRKNIYNKNVYRESKIYYIQFLMIKLSLNLRGGSRRRVQGVRTPPWDDLRLSYTTGILPKNVIYWC